MLKKYVSSRMPSNIRKSLGLDYVHRSNSNLRANWVLQVFNDVSDMLHVFRSKLFWKINVEWTEKISCSYQDVFVMKWIFKKWQTVNDYYILNYGKVYLTFRCCVENLLHTMGDWQVERQAIALWNKFVTPWQKQYFSNEIKYISREEAITEK